MSADIGGLLLQVGVVPQDRPSVRFMWREDPASAVAVFQYVRLIFGSEDSPTCANYALRRTATDNQSTFPEAAQSVLSNFYMDDYLESCPTVEEATRKAEDLVKLLSLGGFKLTMFVSNVPSTPAEMETDPTLATEVKEIPSGEESSHVLGWKRNHATDTLVVCRGTDPDIKPTVTQRVVLSLVSSVYDPIGLVAPYTVKSRLLLKDIWRLSGQQWDDDLPADIVTKILDWNQKLPALSDIPIARAFFQGKVEALELHILVIVHKTCSVRSSYPGESLSVGTVAHKQNSRSYLEKPERHPWKPRPNQNSSFKPRCLQQDLGRTSKRL